MTDVRNFGFFVDVTGLGMSGLVPLSGLSDDFYQFDATRGQLLGRRTRRVFKLGDKVEVQVAKVDTFKKQVDFKLAGSADDQARRASRPERPSPRPRAEKQARAIPPRSGPPSKAQGRKWHPPRQGGWRRPGRAHGLTRR